MSEDDRRKQIENSRRLRDAYLWRLYERRQEGQHEVPSKQVGGELRLSDLERDQIEQYWNSKGMIEFLGFGPVVALTQPGIEYVEESIVPRHREAAHGAVNLIHVEQMHGSQIQQGTTHSTQSLTVPTAADLDTLTEILSQLRTAARTLPAAEAEAAVADIDAVVAQANSPRPRLPFIRECLVTLRAVFENAAGDVSAAHLIAWMKSLGW